MKYLICFTLFSLFPLYCFSQTEVDSHVSSKENIVQSLYAVISGDAGVVRDWNMFKSLFTEDAKLIPVQKNKQGEIQAAYLSPQDYIDRSGKWLFDNGFFEKEIHRVEECFGNICHLFSTYEAYRTSGDKEPFMRGINSIQLMFDNERWWIVNISWQAEDDALKLTSKYLPLKE